MGKILDYSNLGAAPADNDLLFMGDYSADASNPTTMRLAISDLNKKRNIDAADTNGLMLRDNDGSTFGIMIHDGGNVGIGVGAATTPGAYLSVRGASDANLTLANFLNPSATTDGKYQQIIFGTDAANDKSVVFRFYYDTTDDASRFTMAHYEDAGSTAGMHLLGNGNVGIGRISPSFKLDVNGHIASNGSYPVVLDGATGEIKATASSLNINKSGDNNVTFMYYDTGTTTVNPAMTIKSSNKRVSIGNDTSPDAKLHIREHASGTATNLKLETYQGTGTVRTIQQFTQTVGASSLHHYLVWDGTSLGINKDGDPLGAASVNFTGTDTHGKIGINAAVGTRVLEATETTSPGIVANFKSTAAAKGSKILLTNSVDAASVDQSQGLGFSTMLGSTETVTWFGGAFRPSGGANNYFALNYVGATFAADTQYEIDTTLTNNEMYLDSSGNVTFKGNVAGDGFYDKGGTTAGNYCRGRFVQTFNLPYYADQSNRFSPLLSTPFDRTDDTAGSTITAKFASIAPHDGRVQSFRASAKNNQADATNCDLYIYAGASLPSGTELSSSDSATVSSGNTQLQLAASANQKITLGYNDFTDKTRLDFSQGDYLMFSIDTDSGNAHINPSVTIEFYIDDAL
jgi:hypothetical protein